MDHFKELLESYNKLKKRTFKLVYINEAPAPLASPMAPDINAQMSYAEFQRAKSLGVNKTFEQAVSEGPKFNNPKFYVYGIDSKGNKVNKLTTVGDSGNRGSGGRIPGFSSSDLDLNKISNPRDQVLIGRVLLGAQDKAPKNFASNMYSEIPELKAAEDAKRAQEMQKKLEQKAARQAKSKQLVPGPDQMTASPMPIGVDVKGLSPEEEEAYRRAHDPSNQQYFLIQAEDPNKRLPDISKKNMFKQDFRLRNICKQTKPPSWCEEVGLATDDSSRQKYGGLAFGTVNTSFESRLNNATSFEKQDNGKWKEVSVSTDQKERTAESWILLTDFLASNKKTPNLKKRCEELQSRIRSGSGNKVVFLDENRKMSRALVVKNPGGLLTAALSKAAKDCGNFANRLSQPMDISTAVGNKQAIKGTFFEKSTNIVFKMKKILNLRKSCPPGAKGPACAEYNKEAEKLAANLVEMQSRVLDVAESFKFDENKIFDAQGAAIVDLIREHSTFNNKQILQFYANELDLASKIIEEIFPNSIGALDSSLNPFTGDRADRLMIYSDINSARADVIPLGVTEDNIKTISIGDLLASVREGGDRYNDLVDSLNDAGIDTSNPSRKIVVSQVGFKRTTEEGDLTLGTVNGNGRIHSMSQGEAVDRLSENFISWIDDTQFEGDVERKSACLKFERELNDQITKEYTTLLNNITQLGDENGNILDINSPDKLWQRLSKSIKGLTAADIGESQKLRDIFYSCIKQDCTPRDWKDSSTVSLAASKLLRMRRGAEYRKILSGKDENRKKQCTDHLVRRLMICGGNKSDLLQSNATDSGVVKTFRHNGVLEEIARASEDGSLEIDVSTEGGTVKYKVGGKVLAELYQSADTRNSVDGQALPHSEFAASITLEGQRRHLVNRSNSVIPKPKNEELLQQFIELQKKLFESFAQSK